MADIFSLTDILVVIFFVMPGFVTLVIIKHIGLFENELSDKELVIWSVLFSLIIFSIFSYKFEIVNFDGLRLTVFNWEQTAWVIGIAIVIGLGVGSLIKFVFRRGTHRGKIWNHIAKEINGMSSYPKVRVITEKKEYEGIFFFSGTDLTARDLVIVNPKEISIDKNGKETSTPLGKEMFFPESSIIAVNFLDPVTYHA